MAKCLSLFPIVMVLAALPLVLGVPGIARAADEPVATAVIPPPLAEPPRTVASTAATPAAPRPKRTSTAAAAPKPVGVSKASEANAGPTKPGSPAAADLWKRIVRSAASPPAEPAKRAVAQKASRHVKREHHLVVARANPLPRYPTRPRYYYPGAPVADPGSDGPPFPPQWYDRYPGPRGPW